MSTYLIVKEQFIHCYEYHNMADLKSQSLF